jgi:excisionase family DNA binding protein
MKKKGKSMDAKTEVSPYRTIAEAMNVLRCSKSKIYALHRQGRLELVKFDRATRVTERSLQKLLDQLETTPLPRPGAEP